MGDCPLPTKQNSVVEDTHCPCRAAEGGLHEQESDQTGTAPQRPPSWAGGPDCREAAAGMDAGGRCLWGPGVCGTQGGSTRMEMCCPHSRRRRCLRLTDAMEVLGGRGPGDREGGPRDRDRASC